MWQLDLPALRDAAGKLAERAAKAGGSLIVVGSPRTPAEAYDVVRQAAGDAANVAIVDNEVRYPVLLADGDEHFVTADSVSMISEAVVTGKPVGLIPVEPDARGGEGSARIPIRPGSAIRAASGPRSRRRAGRNRRSTPSAANSRNRWTTAVAAVRRTLSGLFE